MSISRADGNGMVPSLFDVTGPRPVTLARLNVEIKRNLNAIGTVVVEGEVHRPTPPRGRVFFTLRDRTTQIQVTVPATRARYVRIAPGERVAVTGMLAFYSERGQVQIEASDVTPVGEGAVAAAISAARERLRADGLLDRPRRALPLLPASVGVVCGSDAAVRRDIESVVAARFRGYPIRFVETAVQGPGAAAGIITALQLLDAHDDVHVIVLARGGGDAAALLPFSDEELCRAIAVARTPVVSAIGHEEDRPLSDEVADHRAGTPSIAAAMVVPDRTHLQARLDSALDAVLGGARRGHERAEHRLERVVWRDAIDRRIERAEARVARIEWRSGASRALEHASARLARVDWQRSLPERAVREDARVVALWRAVEAMAPARVLERGYAVVRDMRGDVVRDPSQVSSGESIQVTVSNGAFDAEVR